MNFTPERLALSTRQAEDLTGFDIKWFEKLRAEGSGPPYIRLPNKRIRYPYPEFIVWWKAYLDTGERVDA